MTAGGIYTQGYRDKYFVIGRDGNKRFFPTKAEANAFRKRIYDKVAVWLNLYEIPRSERIALYKEFKRKLQELGEESDDDE